MVKPSKDFNASEKRAELRTNLNKIKGVQEVRLDNDWMEKLTALSWLFAHVAIFLHGFDDYCGIPCYRK